MKIRQGFISNSSSASFIIAFPKEDAISLKDIENYLGSVNKKFSPDIKDMILFTFWKSQYFDEEMYKRNFKGSGKKYDFHFCNAPWEIMISKKQQGCCRGYMNKNDEGEVISPACENCKYNAVEKRIDRGDDFYQVWEGLDTEGREWLEKHKNNKIIYLEIKDSNPPKGIPWEIADEITSNSYTLFENSTNVWCLDGK